MTKAELKTNLRLYRELDSLAVTAAARNDHRSEGRYLDARSEIARIIYEADYPTWKATVEARVHRKSSITSALNKKAA